MCVVCVPLLSELLEEVYVDISLVWCVMLFPLTVCSKRDIFEAMLSCHWVFPLRWVVHAYFVSSLLLIYIVDLTSLRFLQDYAKRNFMLACFKAWTSSTTLYTTKIHLYSEKIVWIFSNRLDLIIRIHLLKNFVILWERKGHMWRGSVVSIFL